MYMQIVIDLAEKDKIWKNSLLSNKDMQMLVASCLYNTSTLADMVFLSVNFVNANEIQKLNNDFRGKNSATNVLSFANCDDKNVFYGEQHATLFLGELFFCFEKIKEEARDYGKTFQERLKHLFVHGILHLLGYDHIFEQDRKKMEKLEEKILGQFGVFGIYTY